MNLDLPDFVSWEVGEDANSMKQTREVREEQFLGWRSEKEDTWRLRAGQAALTLSRLLTPRVQFFVTVSFATMVRRAARDLLPLHHFPSAELRDEHRALGRSTRRRVQRRHHHVS